ncbi:MAG: MBL fold metallo-hydrolase, partial [Pseudomonadota bacterium]
TAGADMLFFDGTLYVDDEMRARGEGVKTGRRMGHISMAGPDGAIAAFAGQSIGRKIFIHINNTNPVLLADSVERAAVEAAGWLVAYDGMELTL